MRIAQKRYKNRRKIRHRSVRGEGIVPRDYYIVLGVSRGADLNKIKKAYRTVAKKYHPDTTQSHGGSEKFRDIREAYETLSDEGV